MEKTVVTPEELGNIITNVKSVLSDMETLFNRLIAQEKREERAIDIIDEFVMKLYGAKLEWITEFRNPEYTDWEDALEEFENKIEDTKDYELKVSMKKDLELVKWAIESFWEKHKADGLWIR